MKEEKIVVNKICKEFKVDAQKDRGALSAVLDFFSIGKRYRKLQVLDDVSFSVNSGEILGVIGKNGSGKSTLLRIVSGIYKPDQGLVKTIGSVYYLSGFRQTLVGKLTMRENIFLIGTLMGFGKKEISKKVDQIVDFSGLKDFIDCKVYKFSSGMITRLSFSATMYCIEHQNPDIILLDEVFGAGGDIDFRQKAIEKMAEFIKKGATVILASHDLELIEKYCNRVILLEKGRVVAQGCPKEVVIAYQGKNF